MSFRPGMNLGPGWSRSGYKPHPPKGSRPVYAKKKPAARGRRNRPARGGGTRTKRRHTRGGKKLATDSVFHTHWKNRASKRCRMACTLAAPNYVLYKQSFRAIAPAVGTQAILSYDLANANDITAIVAQGLPVQPVQAPNISVGYDIFVKSVDSKLVLTNMTTMAQEITIREISMKNSTSADSAWQGMNVLNPARAWNMGYNLEAARNGRTPAPADWRSVGQKPTVSKIFNDFYKITKTRTIPLSPGETDFHNIRYDVNKSFNEFTQQEFNQKKGMTRWLLITSTAQVVDSTANHTIIDNGQADFGVVFTQNFDFRYINNADTTTRYISDIAAFTDPEQIVVGNTQVGPSASA